MTRQDAVVYVGQYSLPQLFFLKISRIQFLMTLRNCQTYNEKLRPVIEESALAWAVGIVSAAEIDKINILQASFLAMHRAIAQLKIIPEHLLIDGNRFTQFGSVPHTTVIEGDGKYLNIAAASILAKTYRDDYMDNLHEKYPAYHWIKTRVTEQSNTVLQ